jgi:DNA polymerase/3'-5' exonuclease PolX
MTDAAEQRVVGAHHLVEAEAIATRLRDALAPFCDRIEIAGSIRRGVSMVKDIELVAIPRVERDLLGAVDVAGRTELDAKIDRLIETGRLAWRVRNDGQRIAQGHRFKALLATKSGLGVDLFLVLPPAQWGAQLAGLHCRDGRLVRADGTEVETPDERSFIEACGAPWAEPRDRR